MRLPAALCVVGTLLTCSHLSTITAASREGDLPGVSGPCSATLAPESPCGKEKDECPFVFNLPPLTVSLPKQLRELEKIVEELQLLKDNVDELRKMCGDCAVSQTERECGRQTEHETLKEERIRVSGNERGKYAIKTDVESDKQTWERENNKGVVNEERAMDGKTLEKDKVEQVVAAGKNVRITQRKNSDRKQIEGDQGAEKNTLGDKDKWQNGMSNAKTSEESSSHLWQDNMMENPKQTEAGPNEEYRTENRRVNMNLGIVEDKNGKNERYVLQDKSSNMWNKDEMDISDHHIWQDNNHKEPEPEKYKEKDYPDHVEKTEKDKKFGKTDENKEEKTDGDRPVWRDKIQVDKNQMETDRYEGKEGIQEEGKTISRVGDKKKTAQSGRHVWRDETMETEAAEGGSAERIKMSEDGDEHTDREQDHRTEMEPNNGKSKQAEREKPIKEIRKELKGEKTVQSYREIQNRKVMEGTDLNSVSQSSVINFIDLDQAVTLTSPPSFTTSHLTTDVKSGQRKPTYGAPPRSSHNKKNTDSEHTSQPTTIGAIGAIGEDATSHAATDTTDGKLDEQKTANGQKSQSNHNEKGRNSEDSSLDKQSTKIASRPTKTTESAISALDKDATSHTATDFTEVKVDERKTAHVPKFQSNHNEKGRNSEDLSLDKQLTQIASQPTKTTESAISALDKDATSHTATDSTEVKLDEQKTANGQKSQSNSNEKGRNSEDLSLDKQSTKIASRPTKTTESAISALDKDATSHTRTDSTEVKVDERKTAQIPKFQSNSNEKGRNSEDLSLDKQSTKIASQPTKTTESAISALDKDATSHTRTDSTEVKVDERKTAQIPKFQSNSNEKGSDSSLDEQSAKIATTTESILSGLVENTASSIPPSASTLRHGASFKDEIESTTFTSRQSSSTTTSPAAADNRRWISPNKKTVTKARPSQSPKLSQKLNIGMKPEANPKFKYPKNDRKPDPASSPDNNAKNDQRQKPVNDLKDRSNKAPERVQIPQTDQSRQTLKVKENEKNNRLPTAVSIRKPPTRRPTLPPSLETVTSSETDEHPISYVTSTPKFYKNQMNKSDEQEKAAGKMTNEGKLKPDQRTKLFIKPVKKTEPKQNTTSNVMVNQNNLSPELNNTKERTAKPNLGPKVNPKVPKVNQKPKLPQVPKVKPIQKKIEKIETSQKTKVKPKPEQAPKDKFKIPKPNQISESKNTSKTGPQPGPKQPTKPLKPASPVTKTKPGVKPKSTEGIPNTHADMAPTSGPVKSTTERTNPQRATEFISSTEDPVSESPKTAHDLEADPFLDTNTRRGGFTVSPNSRVTSDEGPQTTSQPPSIPLTTPPNKTTQASTNLSSKRDSSQDAEEKVQVQTSTLDEFTGAAPRVQISPTVRSDFRLTTPAASGPKAFKATTPSARELRVKINQVAAFLNKSIPHAVGRPLDVGPGDHHEDEQGGRVTDQTDSKYPPVKPATVSMLKRDCSDHVLRGQTKSGLYLVTPDLSASSFHVVCDMEQDGGGWTVLQSRQDGSVSFNRTWVEYREGFGELNGGEFWLGNNMIHLLTRARDMVLRVELEDFEGAKEYAQYEQFKVASERMRYRLTVNGYSGTAGDALRFNKMYDHNNRAFTTPDRDNDRYPSGNCGAYYSSGWWFDACMAANLNGRYYMGRYKGVRDGIYWGTWHNISSEYYPTNERQSFKTVRMMIRPKGFKP